MQFVFELGQAYAHWFSAVHSVHSVEITGGPVKGPIRCDMFDYLTRKYIIKCIVPQQSILRRMKTST